VTIAGVIFDLDGTLADTLPVCFAAFRETFQRHLDRTYSDDEIYAMFGPSEEGIMQSLLKDRWQEGHADYLAAYEREHDSCPAVFPCIDEALDLLRGRGARLAIVTAKGPGSAEISVRRLGLTRHFDVIESGSPQGGIKPERIRRVLARWNLPAERTAYVGDSVYDVQAAREVGALPLAAGWATTANLERLRHAEPCALFETVEQFAAWIADHVPVRGT
jgi:pyrophosphatase PpaX